ncbi:MAG: hypothetical protein AAF701_09200, partial [Pseudomonadota bacterium]
MTTGYPQPMVLPGRMDRWRIRRATYGARPKGFVGQPDPRVYGSVARGRQLIAGNIQCTGHLVDLQGLSPWDI